MAMYLIFSTETPTELGRVRVFADRADIETEARLIQHHARERAADERDPRQQIVSRNDAAQEGDLVDQRNVDVRDQQI